ncbi:AMP-binding protein, partial [Mycobacterium tuberculosis]|nr:AMP-binding protein [Mycobacterium tuberculosis]
SKNPAINGFSLRRASSAGEPLTPDVITWARTALGTEVRDHYGQTEHGMFINNHWADDLRRPLIPGSMGQPMPGFAAGIVDDAGAPVT